MNVLWKTSVAIVGIWLCGASVAFADDCSALLAQGVFDSVDVNTEETLDSVMSSWMCEHKNSQSGSSTALNVQNMAEGWGFDGSHDSWDNWSSAFCQAHYSQVNYKVIDRTKIRTASQALIDGYNQCRSTPGVWMTYVPTKAPDEFVIRFNLYPPTPTATSVDVKFQGAKEAGCKNMPAKIKAGAAQSVLCKRTNVPRTIVMNAQMVSPQSKVEIPALVPKPDCTVPPLFDSGNQLKVYAGACLRNLQIAMVEIFDKGCDTSEEKDHIYDIAKKVNIQTCRDYDFSQANFTEKNCSAMVVLQPGEIRPFRVNVETSNCSNPRGNRTLSIKQLNTR